MRSLWKRQATVNSNNTEETYDSLLKKYASRPTPKKLWELSSNAVVVSQQVALTCYFLARHSITFNGKDDETLVQYSTFIIVSSLFIIMAYSLSADQSTQQPRKDKARQRFLDAILLAILLRLIASLLRTLTASYSSDTVQVLVAALMLLHLIACDYSYANGVTPITRVVSKMPSHRPIFRGGTISLNAALFATTLLISRLQSNILAYFYVALAIVVFAFYPSTRYSICNKYPAKSSGKLRGYRILAVDSGRSKLTTLIDAKSQRPCGSLHLRFSFPHFSF